MALKVLPGTPYGDDADDRLVLVLNRILTGYPLCIEQPTSAEAVLSLRGLYFVTVRYFIKYLDNLTVHQLADASAVNANDS